MALSDEEKRKRRNAYIREWKKRNKEKVNATNRAVKAKNPEKYKEINRRSARKRRIERPELQEYARIYSSDRYKADPEGRKAAVLAWVRAHPGYYMLKNAEYRSRKLGLPFNLTLEDIVIPEVCPVLGMKFGLYLGKGRGGFKPDAPSLDRIIPSKGYVRGNIRVISNRANRIKCDATLEELKAIVAYVERETG